jgi:GH24 family phage-related lysozyme (muramidase)
MKLVSLIEDRKKFDRQARAISKYKKVKETYFDVMYRRKIEQVPGENPRTGTDGVIVKIEKNTKNTESFLKQLVNFFMNDEKRSLLRKDFEKQAEDDKETFRNKLLKSLHRTHKKAADAVPLPALGLVALLPLLLSNKLIDKIYGFFMEEVGGPIENITKTIAGMTGWGAKFLGNMKNTITNVVHKTTEVLSPITPAAASTPIPTSPVYNSRDPIADLIKGDGLIKKPGQKLTMLTGTGRQKAFELIAAEEGDSKPLLTSKIDAGSGGALIGYSGEARGRTRITKEQADRDLYEKIDKITKLATIKLGKKNWAKLNDDQKAAIISQAYNARGIHWSAIKKALDHDNFAEAAREIGAGPTGETSNLHERNPNLVNRRATEEELFAHGDLKTKHIVQPAPDITPVPRSTGAALMSAPPSKNNQTVAPVVIVNNTNNIQQGEQPDATSFAPQNVDSPYHMTN